MSHGLALDDPYATPPRRRRTAAAAPLESVNAFQLDQGLSRQRKDARDSYVGEAPHVGRFSTPDTGSAAPKTSILKGANVATQPIQAPRLEEDLEDPFPRMGTRTRKSKVVVPISMAQQTAWREAHAVPQVLTKPGALPGLPHPRKGSLAPGDYCPPTHSPPSETRRFAPAPSAPTARRHGTAPGTQASASSAHASSSSTRQTRVVKEEPVAVGKNMALLTPPPSGKRSFPSRVNSRLFRADRGDDSEGKYLPSPTKTPVGGRRGTPPDKSSLAWPNAYEVKQEERLPAPDFTSTTGLLTPESSPVKRKSNPLPKAAPAPCVISGEIFPQESPFHSAPPPESQTIFRTIPPYECTIESMPREIIIANGEPFLSYKCKNGHTLRWFQAEDFEVLVSEAVSRAIMQVNGDDNKVNVAQGRILHYEMGLGKTHVACLVVVEVLQQVRSLYEERGLKPVARPVLVIADKSLQPQWKKHFSDLSDSLRVAVYDKGNKPMPHADVIICNIYIFRNQYERYLQHWEEQEAAFTKAPTGRKPDRANPTRRDLSALATAAPFFITIFQYMVIDESHSCIANAYTAASRSVLTVKANHVLLLSGTPIQNKLGDLDVPLATLLHSSRRKDFREAEALHRRLNRGVNSKNMRVGDVVDSIQADDALIAQTTITRLNHSGIPNEEPLIILPPRTDYVVMIDLDDKERALYNHFEANTYRFVKLTRTRQATLHPALLRRAFQELHGHEPEDGDALEELGENVTDAFKMDVDDVDLPDIHGFTAPEASEPKRDRGSLPPQAAALGVEEIMDDNYLPSRFRIVLGILFAIWRERPDEKVIVFSSFTSVLQLLEYCLDECNIAHIKYTGVMSSRERQDALQIISEDAAVKVMLVSMKAGGVGLNITAANNVIILDPWWNPYVEEQAVSRVHRQGQIRDVHVFRILSPDTIDMRVKEIQDQKRVVVDGHTRRCVNVTAKGRSVKPVAASRAF